MAAAADTCQHPGGKKTWQIVRIARSRQVNPAVTDQRVGAVRIPASFSRLCTLCRIRHNEEASSGRGAERYAPKKLLNYAAAHGTKPLRYGV